MTGLVLAGDLGAGSLRVGAVTAAGEIVAESAVALAAAEPLPGWSEIDPEIWWQALGEAVAATLAQLSPEHRVVGLCLSGLTRTQVLLDAAGGVLRPALLFRDSRAGADAANAAPYFTADNPADAISAFHPFARLAWLQRCEPTVFERLAHVAEPKDFLNFRLTGRLAGDSVTYSRFDALRPKAALPEMLHRCLAFLEVERLAPWAAVGSVTCREPPFDRLASVPVFAGAMDAWAASVGAGAVRPGQAYDIAGTSEVVGLVTATRVAVPGLVSLAWGGSCSQIGGPTQIGADGARWGHETFRVTGSLADAVERAGARVPEPGLPLFLPYLAGERAPVWRDDVGGVFHGVARQHGPDDFLWAVLEGTAQAVRDILATTGLAADEIRICGGGARSDAWCQLKADVTGIPVRRVAARETGLIGSAMAAWIGAGRHPDLAAAADAMCPINRRFEPQPDRAPFHAGRAALYDRVKTAALALADAAKDASP